MRWPAGFSTLGKTTEAVELAWEEFAVAPSRFLIERHVTDLHGQPISAVAALGVASLKPGQADAAALAGYVREQWSIESLHWLRDTLYQEDKSKVRTRSGPRVMAALRNDRAK